jgi:hypothetical protein
MPNYPINHGGIDNGGTAAFFRAAESGILWPWDYSPEFQWEARIGFRDLTGPAATQGATITIPASGFVSGRITATFTGYGLVAPVAVTADAAVADDEEDLAAALDMAIDDLIATTLAGVVASVSSSTNTVPIVFAAGIASGTVTVAWRSAQQTRVRFAGTPVDGPYVTTIGGVAVTTTRAAASPANIAAIAVQHEADIEALIATTLADVVVSADDDGVDDCIIIFEPDIATVTVTTTPPSSTTATFGGTETDGDYSILFAHATLPSAGVTITVPRAGGSPATNTDLADEMEVQIEASAQLAHLVSNADNTAGVNTITTFAGVTGLTVTATAVTAPATLVMSPMTMTVADVTPVGPVPTVAYSSTIALNTLNTRGAFPTHVWRLEVALEVTTAFGANRTITVGDADATDGLMGSTPVTLNTTGRTLAIAADTEYIDRYESGLVPTVTIAIGATAAVTQGVAFIQINYAPHVSHTASAA